MRRFLLVALALGPAVALAATTTLPVPAPGTISFGTQVHSPVDAFINAAECAGLSPLTLLVRWDVENASSGATGTATSFTVYAHNSTSAHGVSSTGACPTNNADAGDTALLVGPVGTFDATETNPSGATGPSIDVALDPTLVVSVAGKRCATTSDEDIILCVQANNGGGTARGKVV